MRGAGVWIATLVALIVGGPATAQVTLNVDGPSDAIPMMAALSRAYVAKTKGVTINFNVALDAQARLDALAAGKIDIAVASYGLKVDDATRRGLRVHEIGRAAVVFAVHAGVPVSALTSAQICAIYGGGTTNWRALGGPDLAIAARTAPDGDVEAEVMRAAIACLGTLKMPAAVKVVAPAGDMVRELATSPGAIGMVSVAAVEQSGGRLRALVIDGVVPSDANVAWGTYKAVREVFLVVKGDGTPGIASFVAFVRGPEGVAILKANGAIARPG